MTSLQILPTDRPLTLRELEIIQDIERREFIIGGATALALVLAGCGDDDSNGATEDGPATRTVDHALGTSEIPTNPQRIVQIGYDSMIAILAELGLADRIIGAFPLFGTESVPEPFADQVGELIFVEGDGVESNLEAVARAQPDLIVGRVSNMETTYAALSDIAPVVAFEGSFSYFDYLDTVAAMFQREDEAAALRQRYEERLAELQGAIEPGRVTITQIPNAETVRVYTGEGSWIVETLALLGAEIIPEEEFASDGDGRADVSLEGLEILAGDTILNIEGTPEQTTLRETFGDTNPLWARLPAVRSDRVFPVDFNRFSGIYGVSGYLELLDQFEQIFSQT